MATNKITYAQIGESAGVSAATVSRVINQPNTVADETVNKVFAAMRAMGYSHRTRTQRSVSSRLIMCVIPDITSPFYSDILNGIRDAANFHGHDLIIMNEIIDEDNIDRIVSIITSSPIDGLIVSLCMPTRILKRLQALVPVVQCCDYNVESSIPYVSIDNKKAAYTLMQYVIKTGFRKIAIVSASAKPLSYVMERYAGYHAALAEAGISMDPQREIFLPNQSFALACSAISTLVRQSNRPECIICNSDVLAASAIKACNTEHLRVPEDISIFGFDNIDMSMMTTPTISTVSQPRYNIGFTSCNYLFDMIHHPELPASPKLLDSELIIRESSSVPPIRE